MTEWTPEEDAVAKVIYDELEGPINDQDFGRQMRQWELSRKIARAAIAAMQPRWRDVRTDPPPRDGTRVLIADATAVETGTWCEAFGPTVASRASWPEGWEDDKYDACQTFTRGGRQPTHWQPLPPLPTAPEDRT